MLSPIEPVAPSTEIRRGRVARVSGPMERNVGDGSTVVSSPDQQAAAWVGRVAERDQASKNRGK